MFFSVARLRHSIALALLSSSLAGARPRELFTSSVSYCAPPQEILVDELEIVYTADNNSVSFDISAASVLPNVNVSANLYLNIYGIQPINYTIDICSLVGGVLCPLPVYDFIGSDSLKLPSSVDLSSIIPGIAYQIPDLEGYAQITLTDVNSNQTVACIQVTLSNGWSMHQYAVEWTTAAIAILALALALWQSLAVGELALAPIRLLDVIFLFQTIAASGLLGLNYPSVYTAFTVNFSWALGLFPSTTTSPIQTSINHMRNLTGGSVSNVSSAGAVTLVNRMLSPYNAQSATTGGSGAGSSLFRRVVDTTAGDLTKRATGDTGGVVVVTSGSQDVLQAGLPIYTNTVGIVTANAFMTIFLIFLILTSIVLVSIAIGYGVWFYMNRSEQGRRRLEKVSGLKDGYPAFARAWGLRVLLCTVFPIVMFAFYQWTLKDSWLSILLSVILLLTVLALILIPMYLVLRPHLPVILSRVPSSTPVPVSSPSWTPYTAPFQPSRVYYVIPLVVAMLVKCFVIGFGSEHGMTQAIIFLIVDVLVLVSLIVCKPYRTRRADILMGYLAIVRIVCDGLNIAFSQSLALTPIPRVVIGIVMAVVFSIAVVIMFLNILVNMGLWRLFKYAICCGRRRSGRTGDRKLSSNPDHESWDALEKNEGDRDAEKADPFAPNASAQTFARPGNPTPPTVGSITPPQSAGVQESVYTESSETTLGEPLPRRWSFQHSRPPSALTEAGTPSTPSYARHSVTPSPSTPSTGLPSRHSRHPSSNAPHAGTIEERYSHEGLP